MKIISIRGEQKAHGSKLDHKKLKIGQTNKGTVETLRKTQLWIHFFSVIDTAHYWCFEWKERFLKYVIVFCSDCSQFWKWSFSFVKKTTFSSWILCATINKTFKLITTQFLGCMWLLTWNVYNTFDLSSQ